MAFLAHMSMKSETHALKAAIIQKADPIKEKVDVYKRQVVGYDPGEAFGDVFHLNNIFRHVHPRFYSCK